MQLAATILGKSTVDKLQARTSAPVLTIGRDTFTRPELAKIGCFNYTAAVRLTQLLNEELKITDTAALYKTVPPMALAIRGLGTISLATLGAAFEAKKLGTLETYIAHHAAEGSDVVTFDTMKKHRDRDTDAERRTTREERARARTRKRAAHEIRVKRHITRSATT